MTHEGRLSYLAATSGELSTGDPSTAQMMYEFLSAQRPELKTTEDNGILHTRQLGNDPPVSRAKYDFSSIVPEMLATGLARQREEAVAIAARQCLVNICNGWEQLQTEANRCPLLPKKKGGQWKYAPRAFEDSGVAFC